MSKRFAVVGWMVVFVMGLGLPKGLASGRDGPTPATDRSLSAREYIAKGMPPIDKPWSDVDYVKATGVLMPLSIKDPTKLPRYKSDKSGEVFARFIDDRNIAKLTDASNSPDERMQVVDNHPTYVSILQIYSSASRRAMKFDAEVLQLEAFDLRFEIAASRAIDDYVAAHPSSPDPAHTASALNRKKAGYVHTLEGALRYVNDRNGIRASEAAVFCTQLKTLAPQLVERLPEPQRSKALADVQRAWSIETDSQVKAGLQEVLQAMKS